MTQFQRNVVKVAFKDFNHKWFITCESRSWFSICHHSDTDLCPCDFSNKKKYGKTSKQQFRANYVENPRECFLWWFFLQRFQLFWSCCRFTLFVVCPQTNIGSDFSWLIFGGRNTILVSRTMIFVLQIQTHCTKVDLHNWVLIHTGMFERKEIKLCLFLLCVK